MKITMLIIFIITLTISSCYYDKEDLINPVNANCDLNAVTYQGTVVALLQSNGCLGCHSGSTPSGNISLAGHNNVKVVAQNGKLYGVINHSPGYSPMPQGGNKMNSCAINKIKAWIDAGSPNN